MRRSELPTLYAKSGKSEKEWSISVKEEADHSEMITKYGVKGAKLKILTQKITKEKKGGKQKAKSHYEIAESQAKAKFDKKIKEGYAQSIADAVRKDKKLKSKKKKKSEDESEDEEYEIEEEEDNKDDIYDNNTKTKYINTCYPMLAYDYNKNSSYIKFPCYVQPKLDGVRALYYNKKLYSRNGNPFPNLQHIKEELKNINLILDGELYTNSVNFEDLVGLVRRETLTDEQAISCLDIKYFIFDYVSDRENNVTRVEKLKKLFADHKFENIELLLTEECKSKEDVKVFHDKYTKLGYEGVILRNFDGLYSQNKRSKDLQKFKMFKDDEFEIIDYNQGQGKESDCVIWVCKTKDGKIFNVRPEGNYTQRRAALKKAKKCIGKMLTVRYQNLTTDGIPRFPVGITIRDYE